MVSSASTTVLSEAALRPARWRASSCRPKLGGALKTSHPPPRPRPSAAPCWPIGRRSCGRASTVPVATSACAIRQGRARSSPPQQRRLEVDKTRKRGLQTGGPAGPSRASLTLALFSRRALTGEVFSTQTRYFTWTAVKYQDLEIYSRLVAILVSTKVLKAAAS